MKLVDQERMDGLRADARTAPRRRVHFNLHDDLAEPINRLVIAVEPDSYVRPHRHTDRYEMLVLIAGRCGVLIFDAAGAVERRLEMGDGQTRIIEFPPETWHSLVAMEGGAVVLEVKPGPYTPTPPADFAAWAPPEGDQDAAACRDWMRAKAVTGAVWRKA